MTNKKLNRRDFLKTVGLGASSLALPQLITGCSSAAITPLRKKPVCENYKHVKLSNGKLDITIVLPDQNVGFYRATRFDWSGMIADIRYKSHTFVQPWKSPHEPENTENAIGTAEEFREPLGYEEAKIGGGFIKIGVGILEKPQENEYIYGRSYKIIKPGTWKIEKLPGGISFEQELTSDSGYGYLYKKQIIFEKKSPVFTISHILKNTGQKAFSTTHYCHNFFIIDGWPIGKGYTLSFPFQIKPKGDLLGIVETKENQIIFLKGFQPGQALCSLFEGFGPGSVSNQVSIKNATDRTGIEIIGDKSLEWINLYAVTTTLCIEPGIRIKLQPGENFSWVNRYRFFEF